MDLPTVKSKPIKDPNKYIYLVYGVPGAGKSTFASKFPKAVFIATEAGLKFLSVFGGDNIHKTWEELKDTAKKLYKGDHNFETIVIDTVDNAWEMCSQYVCKKRGIEHESDEEYGKGWAMVSKEFKLVIGSLANKGYGLIFISHEKEGEREEKGVKRKFIDSTLGNSGKKYIHGLVDMIFYLIIDNKDKRVMRTKASPNINAKDRSGILPEVMETSYDGLMKLLGGKK